MTPQEQKYMGVPIKEGWFAIVDLEDNSISRVEWCVGDAREVLLEEMLSDFEDEWRAEHPEHKGINFPDEAIDSFEKRFVIVRCRVTIARGEEIWNTSRP